MQRICSSLQVSFVIGVHVDLKLIIMMTDCLKNIRFCKSQTVVSNIHVHAPLPLKMFVNNLNQQSRKFKSQIKYSQEMIIGSLRIIRPNWKIEPFGLFTAVLVLICITLHYTINAHRNISYRREANIKLYVAGVSPIY